MLSKLVTGSISDSLLSLVQYKSYSNCHQWQSHPVTDILVQNNGTQQRSTIRSSLTHILSAPLMLGFPDHNSRS